MFWKIGITIILWTDCDGSVNFDEFLIGIRVLQFLENLHLIRVSLIVEDRLWQAFLKFDKDGNGCIDAAELKGNYNCGFHPKVVRRDMSTDEVFLEFLTCFSDKNRDGKI